MGDALLSSRGQIHPTWGQGSNAPAPVKAAELTLEQEVSTLIRDMPFLCLPINDEPGPASVRGVVERNAIALLNNASRDPIDPPSATWLGLSCRRGLARSAGLWNSDHVGAAFDPRTLDLMAALVANARSGQ